MEVLAKDGFSYFVSKIKPTLSHSIMTGITATAGSASSPYLSVKWSVANVDGITTPYNGMRVAIKIPMTGVGTAGAVLSIDGGTTWHPLLYNTSLLTGHFPVNSIKYFTYDANQSANAYITAGTVTSITGCWKGDADYDSTNLYMDYLYAPGGKAGSNGIMRNSLVMRKSDDTYESFTTTNGTGTGKTINTSGFYPGELYYYSQSSNLAAGGTIGTGHIYAFYTNILDARYSFNCGTTLTGYKAFYVVGKIQNGLFYLQSPYWSNSLPSTEDGKVYMLIGRTYDTYRYTLFGYHPMFEYKNGALREYCPVASVPTETDSEVTGIAISNHSTGTVSSKKSGSNGSASTWAFTEVSIPNVTNAGSASSWTFEEKTIPNVTAAGSGSFTQGSFSGGSGSFSATVTNHVLSFSHSHTAATHGADSHTHTAPTIGTAIKVQSKSGGSNGTAPTLGTAIKVQSKSSGGNGTAPSWVFEDKTVVTSATHSITDNGHTHSLS